VCTYITETLAVTGSAKGATGWIRVTDATVYYDHPVHALADHTLNIDLRRPADGVAARLGIELSADSARSLAETILAVLASAEAGETAGGSEGTA
jgi:hypothetical protein